MKALSKEWAESKLPNEDGQEIGAGCPASALFGVGSGATITRTGAAVTIARTGPFTYGSINVPATWVQLTKHIRHPVNLRWTDMLHHRHLTPNDQTLPTEGAAQDS